MAKIRVMSWNIENIGDSKLYPNLEGAIHEKLSKNYLTDYIVNVIRNNNIDVLAIMEVVGNEGRHLGELLQGKLGGDWQYRASSQQRTSTKPEQVLYLWRENANAAPCHPPASADLPRINLLSIIDDDSLEQLWSTVPTFSDQQKGEYFIQIYAALLYNKYVDRGMDVSKVKNTDNLEDAYFVRADKWSELRAGERLNLDYYALNRQLNPPLNPDQTRIITNVLVNAGIILFAAQDDRVPYLLNMQVGGKTILLSTLHLPGPDSTTNAFQVRDVLLPAIANLTLCDVYRNATNLLIMGDFNVQNRVNERAQYQSYYLDVQRVNTINYSQYRKGALVSTDDFFRDFSNALGVRDLLGIRENTSLSSRVSLKKMMVVDEDFAERFNNDQYTVNPYDKFFFKSTRREFGYYDEEVVDLIQTMNFELVASVYQQSEARSATKYLKSKFLQKEAPRLESVIQMGTQKRKRKAQSLLTKRQRFENANPGITAASIQAKRSANMTDDEVRYMERISNQDLIREELEEIDNLAYLAPTDGFSSFIVYRNISDHLPIAVTLDTDV